MTEPRIPVTEIEWIKEARGTHTAYFGGREVAAIQGDGFTGWRYRLKDGDKISEWSSRLSTVRFAKTMAENALRHAKDAAP